VITEKEILVLEKGAAWATPLSPSVTAGGRVINV